MVSVKLLSIPFSGARVFLEVEDEQTEDFQSLSRVLSAKGVVGLKIPCYGDFQSLSRVL